MNIWKTDHYNTDLAGDDNDSIAEEVFISVVITGVIYESKGWIDSAADNSEKRC